MIYKDVELFKSSLERIIFRKNKMFRLEFRSKNMESGSSGGTNSAKKF
jgi:hypothetical protein